jgi:hypothetical protein
LGKFLARIIKNKSKNISEIIKIMKRTYYPHYYSIEDILVTQERVPCVAEQELSKFKIQIISN